MTFNVAIYLMVIFCVEGVIYVLTESSPKRKKKLIHIPEMKCFSYNKVQKKSILFSSHSKCFDLANWFMSFRIEAGHGVTCMQLLKGFGKLLCL